MCVQIWNLEHQVELLNKQVIDMAQTQNVLKAAISTCKEEIKRRDDALNKCTSMNKHLKYELSSKNTELFETRLSSEAKEVAILCLLQEEKEINYDANKF